MSDHSNNSEYSSIDRNVSQSRSKEAMVREESFAQIDPAELMNMGGIKGSNIVLQNKN